MRERLERLERSRPFLELPMIRIAVTILLIVWPPASPAAVGSPTLAMVAAGVASIGFDVAIASLWGIVVPTTWKDRQ